MFRKIQAYFRFIKKMIRAVMPFYAPLYIGALFLFYKDLELSMHVIGIASIYAFFRKFIYKRSDSLFFTHGDKVYRFVLYIGILVMPLLNGLVN